MIGTEDTTATAVEQATAAANDAGITVREVTTVDGAHAVATLFEQVWDAPPGSGPVQAGTMRAAQHVGAQLSTAHLVDDPQAAPVSATFAFHAADGHLHSHVTGVLADHAGRGIGVAMKLHQRAWCLARGIERVSWTFDPLVRRNAWLNLGRLGAEFDEYLVSFYGPMHDGINAGDDTDRILVSWDLASPHVAASLEGTAAVADPAPAAVTVAGDRPREHDVADVERLRVELPRDIEGLRTADRDAALHWRRVVRAHVHDRWREGWRVLGVTDDGHYVLAGP